MLVERQLFRWPQNSCRFGENQLGYFFSITSSVSLLRGPAKRYAPMPPPPVTTGAPIRLSSNAAAIIADFPSRDAPVMMSFLLSMDGSFSR